MHCLLALLVGLEHDGCLHIPEYIFWYNLVKFALSPDSRCKQERESSMVAWGWVRQRICNEKKRLIRRNFRILLREIRRSRFLVRRLTKLAIAPRNMQGTLYIIPKTAPLYLGVSTIILWSAYPQVTITRAASTAWLRSSGLWELSAVVRKLCKNIAIA